MDIIEKVLAESPIYNTETVVRKSEVQKVGHPSHKESDRRSNQYGKPKGQFKSILRDTLNSTQTPSPEKAAANTDDAKTLKALALFYRTLFEVGQHIINSND